MLLAVSSFIGSAMPSTPLTPGRRLSLRDIRPWPGRTDVGRLQQQPGDPDCKRERPVLGGTQRPHQVQGEHGGEQGRAHLGRQPEHGVPADRVAPLGVTRRWGRRDSSLRLPIRARPLQRGTCSRSTAANSGWTRTLPICASLMSPRQDRPASPPLLGWEFRIRRERERGRGWCPRSSALAGGRAVHVEPVTVDM